MDARIYNIFTGERIDHGEFDTPSQGIDNSPELQRAINLADFMLANDLSAEEAQQQLSNK